MQELHPPGGWRWVDSRGTAWLRHATVDNQIMKVWDSAAPPCCGAEEGSRALQLPPEAPRMLGEFVCICTSSEHMLLFSPDRMRTYHYICRKGSSSTDRVAEDAQDLLLLDREDLRNRLECSAKMDRVREWLQGVQ